MLVRLVNELLMNFSYQQMIINTQVCDIKLLNINQNNQMLLLSITFININVRNKLILQQNKQQMKKISHFTIDDILQRRTFNSLNKQSEKNYKNSKRKSTQYEQQEDFEIDENEVLMHILQEFDANKKNHSPAFSHDVKAQIVSMISKRLNLKLNAAKIIPRMKIKRIQHIQVIDKPHTNASFVKRSSESLLLDPRKLDMFAHPSRSYLNVKKLSYFVLSGSIYEYERNQGLQRKKSFMDEEPPTQTTFYTWKQFETEYPGFQRVKTYSQFMVMGSAFQPTTHDQQEKTDKEQQSTKQPSYFSQNQLRARTLQLAVGEDSILVEIQNPDEEQDYINHLGMEFEKMAQIIENFSIFRPLGKKIRNYVQFFQFKEYQRNQQVYTIGDPIDKFYLLLKGQIVFEHNKINPLSNSLTTPQGSRKSSLHMQLTIKTETVSSGSYFGQEEMIFQKPQRLLSAKCKSSKCAVFEIHKQKFEKMLEYSDFLQCIKRAAEIKYLQRMSKLQKNQEIRTKFASAQFNEDRNQLMSSTQRPSDRKTISVFGTPKASSDGRYKVMHGNVIRQFSKDQKQKMNETVEFSMLKVNPDMYEKTVDKFRKYNIKPKQKYKPQINWDLKRVWKVLNLENVLRDEVQISSPEGRKLYDTHKRYMYHLRESKSLRPKTTSSTYRTKLQYIAYLQQFKPQR